LHNLSEKFVNFISN